MKQSKEKILKLAELLPWGAKTEISKRTGIAPKTVIHFFKGEKTSYNTRQILFKEAEKIIDEHNLLM